jgi:TrmH family RNA methyltransferase
VQSVITSTKNDMVKSARRLKLKKGRAETGLFLVEGAKCVGELITHRPHEINTLFVSGDAFENVVLAAQKAGAKICRVSDGVMEAICDCKTPQGIAATAKLPVGQCDSPGFIVALDHVQDPSNLGTIIRTADAGGASCVVLSQECADPYAPKAVRASMGSLFHLPVMTADLKQYLRSLLDAGYEIAGAHLDGQTEYRLDWRKTCLVIGNESHGLSSDVKSLTTQLIKIPMFGKAESLNAAVAAGILIYKIRT